MVEHPITLETLQELPAMSTVYLYIKQHSITGLKYFGRTIFNPFEYNGSGKYWVPHYKKYGKEYIKTLEVWGFDNQELCTEFALNFSLQNDIVKSKQWANLVLEDGTHSNNIGQKGSKRSRITKEKISKSSKGKPKSEEHKAKISAALKGRPSPLKGIPNSPEHNINISKARIKMRDGV